MTMPSEKSLRNLKPAKPGEVRNPKGRPKDKLGEAMRMLTAQSFAEMANLIVRGNIADLQAVINDKDAEVLKKVIATTVVNMMKKGDINALDTLLNRLVGKVKDKVEVNNTGGPQVIITLPSNGREVTD